MDAMSLCTGSWDSMVSDALHVLEVSANFRTAARLGVTDFNPLRFHPDRSVESNLNIII